MGHHCCQHLVIKCLGVIPMGFDHTLTTIDFVRGKILGSINGDEIEMLSISTHKFILRQFFSSLNNFKKMLKKRGEVGMRNIINNGPHLGVGGDRLNTEKSC